MLSFKNQIVLLTGTPRGVSETAAIKFAEAGAAGVVISFGLASQWGKCQTGLWCDSPGNSSNG